MSGYGDAIAAMLRAVEALSDARDAVRAIAEPEIAEAEHLGRIRRRIENAGAQIEIDRRAVDEIARRAREDADA